MVRCTAALQHKRLRGVYQYFHSCMPRALLSAPHMHPEQRAWMCLCAQQRDPGRSFVLGERIAYVLLPGPATQDEAAEEPLAAAKAGLQVGRQDEKGLHQGARCRRRPAILRARP